MVHIMDITNMELQQHGIDVVLQLQADPEPKPISLSLAQTLEP